MPKGKTSAKTAKTKNDISPLVDLIQAIAKNVEDLSEEVRQIKESQAAQSNVQPQDTPVMVGVDFNKSVPANMLKTAHDILGNKFTFECIPSLDMPQFEFVVIVPPEYSPLPPSQTDRRTRVISNALGENGVKAWCELVKQNIVKTLGRQLPVNA